MNNQQILVIVLLVSIPTSILLFFWSCKQIGRRIKSSTALETSTTPPPSETPQEIIMQDYRASTALKQKDAEESLHLFFSPHRIPIGMTDDELGICILLYQLRQSDNEKRITETLEIPPNGTDKDTTLEQFLWPLTLPNELISNEIMTRDRFQRGIYKYLAKTAGKRIAR